MRDGTTGDPPKAVTTAEAEPSLIAGLKRGEPLDELLPAFDENACRIEAPWQRLATPDEVPEDLVKAVPDARKA